MSTTPSFQPFLTATTGGSSSGSSPNISRIGSSPAPSRYSTPSPHPPGIRSVIPLPGGSPILSTSSSNYPTLSLPHSMQQNVLQSPQTPHTVPKISLVQFIGESGPKSVLKEYLPSIITTHYGSSIKESDLAQVLGMMASTQSQLSMTQRANKLQITAPSGSPITSPSSSSSLSSSFTHPHPVTVLEGWNWPDFVDVINDLFPYINWTAVVGYLDYPEFYIQDMKGVELIVRSFYYATRHTGPPAEFPIFLFIQKIWENAPGQLSFLRFALLSPAELGIFTAAVKSTSRRLLDPEEIEVASGGVLPSSTTSTTTMFTGMIPSSVTTTSIGSLNNNNSSTNTTTRHALLHLYHQPWNALDMLEVTVHLLDVPPCYEDARVLLELAAKQAPELLCLGLATLRVGWATPVGDLLAKLTGGFLVGQPGASIVLPRLWRVAPSVLLGVMGEMHRRDPSCVSRLLDIAQDLKALPVVLAEARSPTFAIDLAALASRREHLNLDKWLQEVVRDRREPFLRALVEYVFEHMMAANPIALVSSTTSQGSGFIGSDGGGRRAPIPPSAEALSLMLKTLAASVPLMSPECAERWIQLTHRLQQQPRGPGTIGPLLSLSNSLVSQSQNTPVTLYARGASMITTLPGPSPLVVAYFENASFQADVEAEANTCYERIYAQEASVQDVLEIMIRLRGSGHPRDTLVFSCMIHNLLDEFRFFSKYPEKELALTGVIFGQLLHAPGLLEGAPLFIALRMVAESLLCWPPDTKLWRFGMTALAQCAADIVARWPSLCRLLLGGVPGLASFPSIIERLRQATTTVLNPVQVATIEETELGKYLEGLPTTLAQTPDILSSIPNSNSLFICLGERASRSLNAELSRIPNIVRSWICNENDDEKRTDPTGAERLQFLVNNVVQGNVGEKAREIAAILYGVDCSHGLGPWLARHLVTVRIGSEPNQHLVYLKLILLIQHEIEQNSVGDQCVSTVPTPMHTIAAIPLLTWTLLASVVSARAMLLGTSSGTSGLPALRNLGAWIGLVTLGLGRPLLHGHIPIKELLLEAHDVDCLPTVLPFVCRILDSLSLQSQQNQQQGQILLPRNPWLIKILGLLVELYHASQLPLKLNLKFEIELLFKSLGLVLSGAGAVPPARLLSAPRRSLDIWRRDSDGCEFESSGSGGLMAAAISTTTTTSSSPTTTTTLSVIQSVDAAVLATAAALGMPSAIGRPFLSAVGETLSQVLPASELFHTSGSNTPLVAVAAPGSPGLLGVILLAWEAALRTLIVPLEMERFGSIATTTASILATTGGSNSVFRMSRSLAAHLAAAVLREPLSDAIARFIESFASPLSLMTLFKERHNLLSELSDRLSVVGAALAAGVCASSVGDMATSVREVDAVGATISSGCVSSPTGSFIPTSPKANTTAFISSTNQTVTPSTNAQAVWEAFGGWNGAPLPEGPLLPFGTLLPPLGDADRIRITAMLGLGSIPQSLVPPTVSATTAQPSSPAEKQVPHHTIIANMDEFNELVAQICELAADRTSKTTIDPLGGPHGGASPSLRTLMKQVLVLALHAPNRDETCSAFAQRLWDLLLPGGGVGVTNSTDPILADTTQINYDTQGVLNLTSSVIVPATVSALVLLLDKLCELSSRVSRQVSDWVLEEAIRTCAPVLVLMAILESGIVSLLAFDETLARSIMMIVKVKVNTDNSSIGLSNTGQSSLLSSKIAWALALVRASCCSWPDSGDSGEHHRSPPFSLYDWEATLRACACVNGGIDPLNLLLNLDVNNPASPIAFIEWEEEKRRNHVATLLDEWSRLIDAVSSSDKTLASFTHQVMIKGFFREGSLLELFWQTAFSWAASGPSSLSSSSTSSPRPVALARWIVFLIRTWPKIGGFPLIPGAQLLPGISLLGMDSQELLARFWTSIGKYFLPFAVSAADSVMSYSSSNTSGLSNLVSTTPIQVPMAHGAQALAELLGALLVEWHAAERTLDPTVSEAFFCLFGEGMHMLRPVLFPRFAFGWLDVLSHRFFLPRLLIGTRSTFQALALGLLLDVLNFWNELCCSPKKCWPNELLGEPKLTLRFHEGLLRLFLVLLHDFPEFLAAHHWQLVLAMPSGAFQLRNLVLSAFPRHLKLLDPFTPSLRIENLPESLSSESFLLPSTSLDACVAEVGAFLHSIVIGLDSQTKTLLDQVLDQEIVPSKPSVSGESGDSAIQTTSLILPQLSLILATPPAGSNVSRPVWIQVLVFYVISRTCNFSLVATTAGNPPTVAHPSTTLMEQDTTALARHHLPLDTTEKSFHSDSTILLPTQAIPHPTQTIAHPAQERCQRFLGHLLTSFDEEGRYLVVSAVANQLRYPNPHTLFCSLLIRDWFREGAVGLRECIARVLLERLVVQRPHPWGLLITFIDLIRSPVYRFWQQPFARSSPDVERLFDTVARSCMQETPSPLSAAQ